MADSEKRWGVIEEKDVNKKNNSIGHVFESSSKIAEYNIKLIPNIQIGVEAYAKAEKS